MQEETNVYRRIREGEKTMLCKHDHTYVLQMLRMSVSRTNQPLCKFDK